MRPFFRANMLLNRVFSAPHPLAWWLVPMLVAVMRTHQSRDSLAPRTNRKPRVAMRTESTTSLWIFNDNGS